MKRLIAFALVLAVFTPAVAAGERDGVVRGRATIDTAKAK